MITVISLILTIIGGLNWLLVGLFNFNLVSWVFAGNLYFIARIIYALVGIASIWVAFYLVTHFRAISHTQKSEG